VGEAGAETPKKKNLHRLQLHPPTSSQAPTVCLSPTARRPTAHQSSSTIMSRSPSPPLPEIKSLYIGQQFEDFPAFKTAMRMWAVSDPRKFTYRFKKSDKTRNNVVCVHAEKGVSLQGECDVFHIEGMCDCDRRRSRSYLRRHSTGLTEHCFYSSMAAGNSTKYHHDYQSDKTEQHKRRCCA